MSLIFRGKMKYNHKFKKKFGQNFIKDENLIDKIINLSDFEENSLVIEIGCGSGVLTKKLANKFEYVLGYEIDKDLEKYLNEISNPKLTIIYDDFLKRDIIEDIKKYKYDKLFIISNLPYYITTPIIEKIINEGIDVYRIIIMVQKEVGDRINAVPNSKAYNSLSVFINYNYDVKKIMNVSRQSFVPQPNVDSIVLKLSKKNNQEKAFNEEHFYKLVRDSFKQKRKILKNNLIDYDYNFIEELLLKRKHIKNIRAEQLSIQDFIFLSNSLCLRKY